jgi:hypothetical protein
MILHLFQDIPYISLGLKKEHLSETYLALLSFLDDKETGSEACLEVGPDMVPVSCGYQNPPDDEDRINVEQMLPQKEKPHDFTIPAGNYEFSQLDHIPLETQIEGELSGYVASGSKNNVFIRMIKENAIVVAIQLLWKE